VRSLVVDPVTRSISVAIASVLILAFVAAGCGASAASTRRRAELGIGVSLAGVLATSFVIAAAPSTKPASIGVTIGFGALAVISAIVFGVAFANEPEPTPVAAPRAVEPPAGRAQAWTLTQQAQVAARAGACPSVLRLGAEVAALDAEFHTVVFARDVAIARCLAPSTGP
jgi:hypothetical protein